MDKNGMQGYNCIIIYSSDSSRLLFCRRLSDPYKGKYNFTGGKIEKGEGSFEAAYRELEEETGITADDVKLYHMMDLTYYNQGCYVEVFAGRLSRELTVVSEKHPLLWLGTDEDFFDLKRFAGEGNIGHMIEQIRDYGWGDRCRRE